MSRRSPLVAKIRDTAANNDFALLTGAARQHDAKNASMPSPTLRDGRHNRALPGMNRVYGVECPLCGAQALDHCRTAGGGAAKLPHAARTMDAGLKISGWVGTNVEEPT